MKALLVGLLFVLAPRAYAQNVWQETAIQDLRFTDGYIRAQYISIVYPAPKQAIERLDQARATAEDQIARIKDFAGYKAALSRFVNSIDDEHVHLRFNLLPADLTWPGFLLAYRGGRYAVAAASNDGQVTNGEEVTGCDGNPTEVWVHQGALYSGGHWGLDSTKASAARALFLVERNPFLARPVRCTIGGRSVSLDWRPAPATRLLPIAAALGRTTQRETSITPFGPDGAWVRVGIFQTFGTSEADQFRATIAKAADLRDKRVIVIDVRGNPGGPYNWFMAFLRALYGDEYTAYYARARLAIFPVFRATPEISTYLSSPGGGNDIGMPPDTAADRINEDTRVSEGIAKAIAAGRPVYRVPHHQPPRRSPKPPANPVTGKVYVLTDYGCASSCIAFADEMRLMPGVRLIGLETFVDSRTGTPISTPLPSGNATLSVPVMTRDGRDRGDNAPVRPDIMFNGDITDTSAIRSWIVQTVLPADGIKNFRPQ